MRSSPGDVLDGWLSSFDWYTFTCSSCGELTYTSRDPKQSLEDFALMCLWIFGEPPVCSECQRPELVGDRPDLQL